MGGKYFQSISIGNTSLFISREGKRCILFRKDPETLALASIDMNIINPDIIYNAIGVYDTAIVTSGVFDIFEQVEFVRAAFQRDKQIVWFKLYTGQLVSLTLDVRAKKAAWHRHTLGGTSTLTYPPLVQDIIVLPNTRTGSDDVFMLVNRNVGIYVEKIGVDFYDYIRQGGNIYRDRMIFLDSTVVGTPALVGSDYEISGLDHLDGETVRVVYANLMVDPEEYTVASGKITVDGDKYPSVFSDSNAPIWVGLAYTSRVETLPPEFGATAGSAIGLLTRFHDVIIRYFKSGNFQYGADDDYLYEARVEEDGEDYMYVGSANAKAFFGTGIKEFALESSPDRDPKIIIEQSEPKPLSVLSLTIRGKVNEG